MTEKRFYVDSSGDFWDRQSNDMLMMDFGLFGNGSETEEIVGMLNELAEENDHLKKEVEEYKEAMKRMMIDMMRG